MAENVTPVRRRIIGLDGPRGVASVCVLIVHIAAHQSPDTAAAGGVGLLGQALIFFFALSGFLLYLPIVRGLFGGRERQPDVRQYAIHRLLRIMPCYLFIFLFANFVLQAVFTKNAEQVLVVGSDNGTGMITDPVTLIANLFLVHTYVPSLIQTGINPSWSLTMEYVFYLSLPILGGLIFAARRRWNTTTSWLVLAGPFVFIVLGSIGKVVANLVARSEGIDEATARNFGDNWAAVILRSFFGGSDGFAFGMIAAVLFVAVEFGRISPAKATTIRRICWAALVPALLAMLVLLAVQNDFQSSATAIAATLMMVIVVIPLAHGERSRIAEVVDWRPLEYLGRISLSMYLWHFPLMIVLLRLHLLAGDSWGGLVLNILLLLGVTFVFASLTYHFIEQPSMKYAKLLSGRVRTKASVTPGPGAPVSELPAQS